MHALHEFFCSSYDIISVHIFLVACSSFCSVIAQQAEIKVRVVEERDTEGEADTSSTEKFLVCKLEIVRMSLVKKI